MVMAVKMTIDTRQLNAFLRKTEKLPNGIGDSMHSYAKFVTRNLRKNATNDPLRPLTQDRARAAQMIIAKKINKHHSVIKMPQSLVYLDSMSPHFVSLRGNRRMMAWAKKYYGSATITGRSTARPNFGTTSVMEGKRSKGAIFVTPHRFVTRTLHNSRKILPNELRKGIRKTYKGSGA